MVPPGNRAGTAVTEAQTQGGIKRLRSILSGSAGNLVEVYDWFAYASFAIYFAKVFFPRGDQTLQLLNAAAVFLVGFLFRPVGAWLMGLYADRRGRRAALVLSICMMCLGSLIIGLCPGYAQIGVLAPAILVAARILQGISMGGEYGTSATYLSEMAGRKHRGFWSGVFYMTLILGQLGAALMLNLLHAAMPELQLQAWGWRIPFFVGGALALLVFWIRRGMDETPSFARKGPERASTLTLFAKHPRASLTVIGLTAGGTLTYYVYGAYTQQFLVNTAHFSKPAAAAINTGTLAIFILMQPLFGALSDRVGRRPLLIAFGVLGSITAWPIMSTLAHTHDFWTAFGLVMSGMLIVSLYTSINAIVKAELFPTEVRALGVALPYALANAIFGGGAEYVALWFKQAGHESGFFTYLTAMILVSLAVYIWMPDTKKTSRIVED
jgi:MHS family alpha-ketoglutarate permease-like MFS transporter